MFGGCKIFGPPYIAYFFLGIAGKKAKCTVSCKNSPIMIGSNKRYRIVFNGGRSKIP